MKGVIVGKKSWGLWISEWSTDISKGLFLKQEILNEFEKHNIKIPESLMQDFNNKINEKQIKQIDHYFSHNYFDI